MKRESALGDEELRAERLDACRVFLTFSFSTAESETSPDEATSSRPTEPLSVVRGTEN